MKNEIKHQYYAALKMLKDCIQVYDDDIWFEKKYQNEAWRICYHAIFYTNIYCSHSEGEIRNWDKEEKEYHDLNRKNEPLENENDRAYPRAEMLEYLEHVEGNIEDYVSKLEPGADCWPDWYNLNQFEFHINNLRHLQHHTAELIERLNNERETPYKWR